jgi:molybdopterin adenylyltransferase
MIRAFVITVSDGASAGTREDRSGPALVKAAQELGWEVVGTRIVADDIQKIAALFIELADGATVDVILSTGGTGLGPRDVTPEAARAVAQRDIPGFGELMRSEGRKKTKFASLSRGGAVTRKAALILNLPGSPKGAVESLLAVADLVPHAVDLLHGRTEHEGTTGQRGTG